MSFVREYIAHEPSLQEVTDLAEPAVLEFGNPWCGYCRRTEPLVEAAFVGHEKVRHIRIPDASGRRLGRFFRVKLWPTFVFLRKGAEVSRLVRPQDVSSIRQALGTIDSDQVT
jgi:thioredoxin 1